MTQWEFDTILKILEIGTPVLYKTLGSSLNNLVIERNNLDEENKKLKKQLEASEELVQGEEVEVKEKKSTSKKSS